MSIVCIQLPPGTEERLRQKASLQGTSLECYLEELAQRDVHEIAGSTERSDHPSLSLDEFDEVLDELVETFPSTACLPIDFSRADIYADHD